jgi:cation transport ATPase
MAKSQVINVLLSIPIAALFVLFISKLIEILTNDLKAEEKIKKNLLIAFIIGIIGILVGWFIFYRSKVKNIAVMLGLFLGSIYLMVNSLLLNWNKLNNDTKLFMIGSVLVALIIISYL